MESIGKEIETQDPICSEIKQASQNQEPNTQSWQNWLDELQETFASTSPPKIKFWIKYSKQFYQEFASILGPRIVRVLVETVKYTDELLFVLDLMEYLMATIGGEFIDIWGKELEKLIPSLYKGVPKSERGNLMENSLARWIKYFPESKLLKIRVQCWKISHEESLLALESKDKQILNLKSNLESHKDLINFQKNEIKRICDRLNLAESEIVRKTSENQTLSEELIKIKIAQKSTENNELKKEIENHNHGPSALKAKIELNHEIQEKSQQKNQVIITQKSELEVLSLKNEIIAHGSADAPPILENWELSIQIHFLNREISEAKEKILCLENELRKKRNIEQKFNEMDKLIANFRKEKPIYEIFNLSCNRFLQRLQNDSNEIQRLKNELEIEKIEKCKANEDARELHRDFERIENQNSNLTQQIKAYRTRALEYQRSQHKLQTKYSKTVEELKIIRNERNRQGFLGRTVY